jgi:ureidoacrylate peracid hydrolase
MKAKETAVVLIEFQNDFCTEGGKLHGGVQAEISRQHTILNAMKLAEEARKKGAQIIHSPFVCNGQVKSDTQFRLCCLQ